LTLETPAGDYFPKAKATTERAIDLNPTLAEAHAVLGFTIFLHEWAWDAADTVPKTSSGVEPQERRGCG